MQDSNSGGISSSLSVPGSTPSGDINAFREILKGAKHIVVLAGAGLSAASGVPTFRGAGGLWRKHEEHSLSPPASFFDDLSNCELYRRVLQHVYDVPPSDAHFALARFAFDRSSQLNAPETTFVIITQNIDGLERRAIHSTFREEGKRSPFSPPDPQCFIYHAPPAGPILIELHGLICGAFCEPCTCPDRWHHDVLLCVAQEDGRSGYRLQEIVPSAPASQPSTELHSSESRENAPVWPEDNSLLLSRPCKPLRHWRKATAEQVLDGADLCLLIGVDWSDYDDAMLDRIRTMGRRGCAMAALGDLDPLCGIELAFHLKGRIVDVVPEALTISPKPPVFSEIQFLESMVTTPRPPKKIRPAFSMEELRSLSNQAIVDMCKDSPNLTEPVGTDFAPPPVYVLASNVVVKVSGWGLLHEYEAKTMILVRQRTTIPVPRVYRFFVHESTCYLVMEYVHGNTLDKCWDSLSNWQKLRIAFTLRNYVQQLRRIRTPQTEQQVPGPVTDDPSLPFPCFTPALGEYIVRPFTSYADLRDWMNGRYRVGEVVRRTLAHCLPFDDSEPLVFTHGDLCPRNLIMGTDGRIWLIDFGCSGIYPRWFEAVGSRNIASLEVPKLWTATRKIAVGDYSAQEEFDIICQAAFSSGIFLSDPLEECPENREEDREL
ncbi:hypothetical protein BN946_scf185012.g14 [Trametes cinnabarina]|uniref:Deacetylase sirtuin-type domain-containing protein n=1 Tax=Pycnoporus cinnabarinus TaxID=5643 RepID=A0A060SLL1_PYCCI|nr:hypothetical protein BN946_scf185012.g14 [Trametes cinnabarina]